MTCQWEMNVFVVFIERYCPFTRIMINLIGIVSKPIGTQRQSESDSWDFFGTLFCKIKGGFFLTVIQLKKNRTRRYALKFLFTSNLISIHIHVNIYKRSYS